MPGWEMQLVSITDNQARAVLWDTPALLPDVEGLIS